MNTQPVNIQLVVGLVLVAINAAIPAFTSADLPMNPYVHAALVALSLVCGALLLYLRPRISGGDLVEATLAAPAEPETEKAADAAAAK